MGLLDVQEVTVRYGGAVLALEDVSLAVAPGETVALLGANGAGKTTLLRAIGGLLAYHGGTVVRGKIRFDGRSTRRADPAWLVARGIAQTLEGRRVFADLTVGQNLRLGAFTARERSIRGDVLELFPILGERLDQPAGLLSGGQQQMLAIARALMARPRLLLLDEPSLGLAPIVVAEIAGALRRIAGDGTAILLADQSTTLALHTTQRAHLLESGRVVASGPTAELLLDDAVRASYLGTTGGHALVRRRRHEPARGARPHAPLRRHHRVRGGRLRRAPGELFAVIGPNGAGKSSLFNALSRVYEPDAGSVRLDGRDFLRLRRDRLAALGVARSFQNLGVFPHLTVLENVLVGRHHLMRRGIVRGGLGLAGGEERRHRTAAMDALDFVGLARHRSTPVQLLPYGHRKRVELARCLAMEPRLMLLDEPVAGMNAAERAEITALVRRLREERDVTVLLVEHDMGMVMNVADRILVLDFGLPIAIGTPAEIQCDERVIRAYLGEEVEERVAA